MLNIKEYVKVENLEQAYELNQKRSTRVLGGMLWLKMSSGNVQTAVDLSGLGLNQIEETEEGFSIGCMTTLRQLELHEGLNAYTKGAMRESVRHIVGVQFRNLATVGGSIFGRYGFSDVLTMLLALETEVELYKGGRMPLETFAQQKVDNDILVRLIVKKVPMNCVYLSHRNTKTDFPVLTCAITSRDNGCYAVVGARPARACRYAFPTEIAEKIRDKSISEEERKDAAKELASQIPMSDNMRASGQYRSHLANVLIRRGLESLQEGGIC